MQIVIDISEEEYALCKKQWDTECLDTLMIAVKYGTPLPKKYGDLVDRDAINERFESIYQEAENCSNKPTWKYLLDKLSMCLDTAQPIIKNNYEEVEE